MGKTITGGKKGVVAVVCGDRGDEVCVPYCDDDQQGSSGWGACHSVVCRCPIATQCDRTLEPVPHFRFGGRLEIAKERYLSPYK